MEIPAFHFSDNYLKKSEDALNLALDTVPFYRSWRSFDPGRDQPADIRYASMPALTKADMRASFPSGLVSGNRDVDQAVEQDQIEYTFTSGSTGEKVINLWNQNWWHRSEMESWKLNHALQDLSYPQKQATLTSALNIGIHCEEDLPMDHRILGGLLFLNEKINILSIQERHYRRWAQELNEFQPVILEANPSLLARLAFWASDHNVRLYSPKVITLTYELPSLIHLRAIQKAFSCPVVSSYGTTETGFVLESCEKGIYHQNTDSCHIDFIPLRQEKDGSILGRILVTVFDNPWSVIVRFDTGDLVRLNPEAECDCGRNEGYLFESIEGRIPYSTFSTEGKLITPASLDRTLSEIPSVRDYALVQVSDHEYHLKIETAEKDPSVSKQTENALKQLYGTDGIYETETVKQLLPGPSGKYCRTSILGELDEHSMKPHFSGR